MFAFIVRILGNSVALFVAAWLVSGFVFSGGIKEFLIAGIVLGLFNMTVRPIIKLISFPVIILTLGLFTIVINALILWLVDYIFDFILISDIISLVLASIVIAIVNTIISGIAKSSD